MNVPASEQKFNSIAKQISETRVLERLKRMALIHKREDIMRKLNHMHSHKSLHHIATGRICLALNS